MPPPPGGGTTFRGRLKSYDPAPAKAAAGVEHVVEIPLGPADRIFEVEYSMPYLSRSAMEPLNCVITPDGDGVQAFNDEQFQTADQTAVEGAAHLPYAISNILTDPHSSEQPVPVQWWRSVGSTHTAFAVERPIR